MPGAFELLADFPKDEKFGLPSQTFCWFVSIPSNITEGSSRPEQSFTYFIDLSLSSSFKLEKQLLIALKETIYKR